MESGFGKIDLKTLSPMELQQFVSSFGKEHYRTVQLMRWLYLKGVHSFDEMTNLSKKFRKVLEEASFITTLHPILSEESQDGTKKFLYQLEDGNRIESVLIPDKKRLTLCLSTQVGCAMGCRFCLTGKIGFKRNLTTSEILNQILAVKETLSDGLSITNIVLMGMGEPLANYENTLKAIELMTHSDGFGFSSRRVTLSTVGLLPQLERLTMEKAQFRLAISLNASDEETRSRLMPINRRHPMKRILEICRKFPLPPRTRITFEYVMIAGENDSVKDANRLLRLLKGIPCKVNLIPLNEAPGIPYQRSSEECIHLFQERLIKGGITALIRTSKGADISAACGQLHGKTLNLSNRNPFGDRHYL